LQKRRVLTDLVTELPEDVDAALVAGGYKGKAGPPALATLVHRTAVLSKAHQMAQAGRTGYSGFEGAVASPAAGRRRPGEGAAALQGTSSAGESGDGRLVNPCADPLVRELLARTRRAYAQRGVRQNKQKALTKDPLQQLLATCDDTPKGIRDRALLLFAWSTGGRRRSEVTSARIEHLQKVEEGAYVFTLGHSKTNQRGELRPEDVKPLTGSAAIAMLAWLELLARDGIKERPIFRRIRRGGHLGEPLAAQRCGTW
jgi:integrase